MQRAAPAGPRRRERVRPREDFNGSCIDPRDPDRRAPRNSVVGVAEREHPLGAARAGVGLLLRPGPQADPRRRQDGPVQRDDLGADRARLHARLRHHRADQLRPRRGVHDRLVRVGVDLDHARRHGPVRDPRLDPGDPRRPRDRDARERDAQHDDRARGLPAAAQRAEARAADHRDRHELHPAERRPAVAPDAGRRARPDRLPEGLLHDLRRARSSTPTSSP